MTFTFYRDTGHICCCSPKRKYIPHPLGRSATLKKCINRVGYTQKKECYLTLPSDRHPEKEVCPISGQLHVRWPQLGVILSFCAIVRGGKVITTHFSHSNTDTSVR